jgi:hypothetical protein
MQMLSFLALDPLPSSPKKFFGVLAEDSKEERRGWQEQVAFRALWVLP